jgi:hypothetical protein
MFALSVTPTRRVHLVILGYGLMFAAPMLPTTGALALVAVVGFAAFAVVLLRAAGAGLKAPLAINTHPIQSGQPLKGHRLVLDTGA